MKVDNQLIDRLAQLSRLEFNDDEKKEIEKGLQEILSFMEQLNEVDTDGVEPLVYINESHNVFREDVVEQRLTKSEVLQNSPLQDENYFKVPKVIQQN